MIRKWTRNRSLEMGMSEQEFSDSLLAVLNNSELAGKVKNILCQDVVTEIQTLRDAVKNRDIKITQLQQKVDEQSHLIDTLEQYSRRNSVRINGIVETPKEDLLPTCLTLFNTKMSVDPPIRVEDIDRLHRVGKPGPGKKRAVLVKFATFQARERVFRAKGRLKAGGRDPAAPWSSPPRQDAVEGGLPQAEYPRLNADAAPFAPESEIVDVPDPSVAVDVPDPSVAADLDAASREVATNDTENVPDDTGVVADPEDASDRNANGPGPDDDIATSTHDDELTPTIPAKIAKALAKKIFINEDLTNKRDYLLFLARQAKKMRRILDTWSFNGNVKIKNMDGQIISVNDERSIPQN